MAERAVLEVLHQPAESQITQENLDHYIAGLTDIGERQRRYFRSFSRMILQKLASNGHTHADVPAPAEFVELKLPYKGTRRFSALAFFAKYLRSSNQWGDGELAHFAELMGRALWNGVTKYTLPVLDGEIKGQAFQKIRYILGWKASGAALILGISYGELRAIEAENNSFPHIAKPAVAEVVRLASRLPAAPPPWLQNRTRFSLSFAMLPFGIPPCPGCDSSLTVVGKEETRVRGLYWSFDCRGCGGKYWSATDGKLQLVNPGHGWRRKVVDRPTCPHCRVECTITGSPGSSMQRHYFACPKCKRHYRVHKGKPVLTTPFLGPRKELSFLPDRTCPNCSQGRLRIHLSPPRVKHYLFNCRGGGSCRRSFIWDEKRSKLVLVKPRKAFIRLPARGRGRQPGAMLGDTGARIVIAAYCRLQGMKNYDISREMYPLHDTKTAAWNAAKRIFDRHSDRITREQQRLADLSDADRLVTVQTARKRVATAIS